MLFIPCTKYIKHPDAHHRTEWMPHDLTVLTDKAYKMLANLLKGYTYHTIVVPKLAFLGLLVVSSDAVILNTKTFRFLLQYFFKTMQKNLPHFKKLKKKSVSSIFKTSGYKDPGISPVLTRFWLTSINIAFIKIQIPCKVTSATCWDLTRLN